MGRARCEVGRAAGDDWSEGEEGSSRSGAKAGRRAAQSSGAPQRSEGGVAMTNGGAAQGERSSGRRMERGSGAERLRRQRGEENAEEGQVAVGARPKTGRPKPGTGSLGGAEWPVGPAG